MSEITIKEASQDSLIAEHFYRLWLDNGVSPDSIDADWQQKTVDFIVEARKNLFFKAYIASIGDRVVASVSWIGARGSVADCGAKGSEK